LFSKLSLDWTRLPLLTIEQPLRSSVEARAAKGESVRNACEFAEQPLIAMSVKSLLPV
jgi:hypothetical protein